MLIHNVFFWLKDDLNSEDKVTFQASLESLKGIQSAKAVYVGTPAETPERPVIDNSYDACLTVILEGMAEHDAYQVDPLHTSFIETCKPYWKQVKIYDAD